MRIAKGIMGLMAVSGALVGCTRPAPQTSAPVIATAPPGIATGSPTDACGIFTAGAPFTMKVNSAFHVIRTGPHVTPHNPNPNPGQLDTYTAITDGQSAQITIQLTGKETFDGGTSAFKLKSGGAMIFCGLTSPDNKTLTFYTFRQSGLATYSSYSLAVLVPDNENPHSGDPALRVTIDPVVDNNGALLAPPS